MLRGNSCIFTHFPRQVHHVRVRSSNFHKHPWVMLLPWSRNLKFTSNFKGNTSAMLEREVSIFLDFQGRFHHAWISHIKISKSLKKGECWWKRNGNLIFSSLSKLNLEFKGKWEMANQRVFHRKFTKTQLLFNEKYL